MNKLVGTVVLTLLLNGCACKGYLNACGERGPTPVDQAAGQAVVTILGEMTPDGSYGPFEHLYVGGVVTEAGAPLPGAKVELRLDDELWGTVRTDESGRYEIRDLVEPSKCDELSVIIERPDRPVGVLLSVRCGEQQLDHDFPKG